MRIFGSAPIVAGIRAGTIIDRPTGKPGAFRRAAISVVTALLIASIAGFTYFVFKFVEALFNLA